MTEVSVITSAIKELIGVESKPLAFEVETGLIKRFAEAIDDPNPLWHDEHYSRNARYGTIVGPPTFLAVFRDVAWLEMLSNIDCPLRRTVNGSNEIEFFEVIRPGDTITASYELIDVKERSGKAGRLLFLTFVITYRNQFADIVAKNRQTVIKS